MIRTIRTPHLAVERLYYRWGARRVLADVAYSLTFIGEAVDRAAWRAYRHARTAEDIAELHWRSHLEEIGGETLAAAAAGHITEQLED